MRGAPGPPPPVWLGARVPVREVGGGGHRSAVLGGRPRWPFPRGAAGPGASLARSLGTRPQRAQGSEGWEGTLRSRGSPSSPAASSSVSPSRPSIYGRTQPPRPRASRGRWNKGLRAAWRLRGACLPQAVLLPPAPLALETPRQQETGNHGAPTQRPSGNSSAFTLNFEQRGVDRRRTRWRRAAGAEKGRRLRVASELEA